MTIDEAIAHAREVAEERRKDCNLAWVWNNRENIKKCAEDHEQLAAWLEELKILRMEKSEFPIIAKDNYEMGYDDAYNKAIDDFAIKLKSRLTDAIYQKDVDGMKNLIDEIAKQLNGGI